MDIVSLTNLLDHPDQLPDWLGQWGLQNVDAGRARLATLVEHGLTLDLLVTLCDQLSDELPQVNQPDEVLAALVDFIGASRSPLALAALFQRDRQALPTLLNVLKLGPQWRKMLVDDPEAFDLLRMTDGQPVAANWLRAEVCGELAHFTDEKHILAGLRRIKQRELLRIVYGDVYKRHRFELVTEQLTILADALLEATIQAAQRKLQERVEPRRFSGLTGRVSIIALGRLGGFETDYSDHVELLLLHEPLPEDENARRTAREYFDRLGRLLIRFLTEPFEGQTVYSVDLPIRLDGQSGPFAGADEVFNFLDTLGRTWHREAAIKTRAAAGDPDLAKQMLRQLQPWIYRRYLNRADETGIRALKRRLQRLTTKAGTAESLNSIVPETTRQIENVVQFLQLLSGGDSPIVRATNTLSAIAGLEQAGVLSVQERIALEDDYRTLRVAEHRMQLGAQDGGEEAARINEAARRASEITSQLLTSAFPSETPASPEADLLLDPQPIDDEVRAVLSPYGFRDQRAAYDHLQKLANEHVQFLSTRRCRYFLSAIATQLLSAVAATPDPDATLANLSVVSDSVGGKGVLWELFSFNPPSLQLYVHLCAASPYLSNLLTIHPGMVDELVDSLQLSRLATREELGLSLQELTRGTREPLALLHGFKHSNHLQIGVRELLGRDTIDITQRALAEVAETCLGEIIRSEYEKLTEKFGTPTKGETSQPCQFAVYATGELGGRELGYQSDVELIFVYEADGMTQLANRGRRESKTANGHFFSQLAQRVAKTSSQLTPWGRLYTVEMPLRSTNGLLAFPLAGLQEHISTAEVCFKAWQVFRNARPIFGDAAFVSEANAVVQSLAVKAAHNFHKAAELGAEFFHGDRPIASASLREVPGGSREIERFTSLLQLKNAIQVRSEPAIGTLRALAALGHAQILPIDVFDTLSANYAWLRQLESALWLSSSEQRLVLPTDRVGIGKLALLLRHPEPDALIGRAYEVLAQNRRCIKTLLPQVITEQTEQALPE